MPAFFIAASICSLFWYLALLLSVKLKKLWWTSRPVSKTATTRPWPLIPLSQRGCRLINSFSSLTFVGRRVFCLFELGSPSVLAVNGVISTFSTRASCRIFKASLYLVSKTNPLKTKSKSANFLY